MKNPATLMLLVLGACASTGPYRLESFDSHHGIVVVRFEPPRDNRHSWPRPRLPCEVEIRSKSDPPLHLLVEDVTSKRTLELNPAEYTLLISQCRFICRSAWVFDELHLRADPGHDYSIGVIDEIDTPEGAWVKIALYDEITRKIVDTAEASACTIESM